MLTFLFQNFLKQSKLPLVSEFLPVFFISKQSHTFGICKDKKMLTRQNYCFSFSDIDERSDNLWHSVAASIIVFVFIFGWCVLTRLNYHFWSNSNCNTVHDSYLQHHQNMWTAFIKYILHRMRGVREFVSPWNFKYSLVYCISWLCIEYR